MWFTDEKIFRIAKHQKSPEWSFVRADCVEKEIAPERLLRTRSTFSKSLMVSVGVSKVWANAATIFIDPAMKINGAYYRDVLLTQQLLPVVQEISGDFFILQQDSAPAHRQNQTSWTGDTRIHCTRPVSPTVQTLTQWTTRYGAKCSSRSTRQKFMTWMNWSSVLSMCGMAWDKTSSMTQLMSGPNVCVHVFVPNEDILSICFDSRTRMW